jgi:hypothetical protein
LLSHSWTSGNVVELRQVAEAAAMHLGPDFNVVHEHHLDGVRLHDPIPATIEQFSTLRERSFVESEVEFHAENAKRLRSAVFDTSIKSKPASAAKILEAATGHLYRGSDVQREFSELLAFWFDPNSRQSVRAQTASDYSRMRTELTNDPVLTALYDYGRGTISWDAVRIRLAAAMTIGDA